MLWFGFGNGLTLLHENWYLALMYHDQFLYCYMIQGISVIQYDKTFFDCLYHWFWVNSTETVPYYFFLALRSNALLYQPTQSTKVDGTVLLLSCSEPLPTTQEISRTMTTRPNHTNTQEQTNARRSLITNWFTSLPTSHQYLLHFTQALWSLVGGYQQSWISRYGWMVNNNHIVL